MDPEEINYKIRFIEKSNEKYFNKVTEITMARNRYFFNIKQPTFEEKAQTTNYDGNSTV